MVRLIDWFVALFNPYTVLTHLDIQELISKGYITADKGRVNATSVDVTLHCDYLIEAVQPCTQVIDLAAREVPRFVKKSLLEEPALLYPNEFLLGATNEEFNLPDNITAIFYMKSSLARCGLDHCNAGFIDPGFTGSRLTLELSNLLKYNILKLTSGMPIGQIKFYRHKFVPKKFSYKTTGQYNGDTVVQESKGVR